MKYKTPTYEEYIKASRYAKIRYRFGVYIQLLALILLLLLIFYTIINVEEMKTNPADYAEKKLGVVCFHSEFPTNINDGDIRDINYIGEG